MPRLLAPWHNPIFIQLISHKMGRLLVPYCLVALFASNLFLLHGPYLVFFIGQVLWYALAGIGWLISTRDSEVPGAIAAENRSVEREICETSSKN
jgi:hypothetical protein